MCVVRFASPLIVVALLLRLVVTGAVAHAQETTATPQGELAATPQQIIAATPQSISAVTSLPDGSALQRAFMEAVDRMMVALAPETARASAVIKQEYGSYFDLLVLDGYDAIETALANGGLVPLPLDSPRFNVRPRVDGSFPIGEKDLSNQHRYMSARTAALGCLLEVAARVTSGPVEITSLVRHSDYQDALRLTNANAITTLPMHTLGLAFDIAIVNTPLKTVYEIRDVLRQMQDAGEVLFIGERKQLVFHVVPHPSRLGRFSDKYAKALAGSLGVDAEATATTERHNSNSHLVPSVITEVIALQPTDEFAAEWWAADDTTSDLTIEVSAGMPSMPLYSALDDTRSSLARFAARSFALVSGFLHSALAIVA
jgi:hypothetical protein